MSWTHKELDADGKVKKTSDTGYISYKR